MWRAILESDIQKQISGVELDALREIVLADGQADPVQPAIDDITAEVRGYVAASGVDMDADSSTIPDRLIRSAVAKIIIDIMTRPAGTMIDPEGARAKAADKADTLLRNVAAGKFSIADPVTAAESTQSAAKPIYHPSRRRTTTRQQQDGI